jgi:hypothetical protein
MPQRPKYFLVVLLLMFAKENFAQEIIYERIIDGNFAGPVYLYRAKNISLKPSFESFMNRDNIVSSENVKYTSIIRMVSWRNLENSFKNYNSTTSISPSIYFNLLSSSSYKPVALFCIAEDKFEKQTSIPLRLRLGSLEYTNYLEQKPNAVKPSY